ncbi:DUF1989 domain-containing protein (plasmid) [Rhodococcus globerulus]|uniref:DUF1989 domain-containing protein n=1 Tax=Rhodococcus globerulus TaxID=33008 RepID=UPI0039E91EAD
MSMPEDSYGPMRADVLITPISGKALPVYKGEVYRIVQVEGGQCVDVNAWSLADSREFMDTSIMRRQGIHTPKGGFLVSNSPYNRLLMKIIEMAPNNKADVIMHRCSRALVEAVWDVPSHSNCQDSLAEAAREYGLGPDSVHAVMCPWTPSRVDENGFVRGIGYESRFETIGDVTDMLALEDVLVATCICGIADYSNLGNFFPRPIRLQIFEASDATRKMTDDTAAMYPPLKGQLTRQDFPISAGGPSDYGINPTPAPDYVPDYFYWPQKEIEVDCELSAAVYAAVRTLVESNKRDDDEDAVRRGVMEWYLMNRTKSHPLMGSVHGPYNGTGSRP